VEVQLFAEIWVFPQYLARIPWLRPEHFADARVRRLFRGVRLLEEGGQRPEYQTLRRELERVNQWNDGDVAFLSGLSDIAATGENVESHARLVIKDWHKREMLGLLTQAVDSLQNPGASRDEVLGQLRRDFDDLEPSANPIHRFPEHLDGFQLYSAEIELQPGIVEGGILRRKHYSMIYGQPGKGKSYLLEQLVTSVATGKPWLGLEVERGRVGVITLEEDLEEVQVRLRAICEHYSLTNEDIQGCLIGIRYLTVDEIPDGVDIERDRDKVVRWIQEYKLDVVVLDPISDAHTRAEVDNAAMKHVTDALNGICRETDVAIAISHHTRKSSTSSKSKDNSLDAARGARLMQSCGGAALYLAEHLGTPCIEFAKIRKGGARERLYLKRVPEGELGEGCLELTDAPRDSKAQGEANREKVVAIVRAAAGERLTVKQVEELWPRRYPGEQLRDRAIRGHLDRASKGDGAVLERHAEGTPVTWSWRDAEADRVEESLQRELALHEKDEE
jgi:hypothetical protein